MDKNVFVGNIVLKRKTINILTKYQLEIDLFDKNLNESIFVSSLMDKDDFTRYKSNVLKVLSCKTIVQAIHSPKLIELVAVNNEKSKTNVAVLKSDFGTILKNEVIFD